MSLRGAFAQILRTLERVVTRPRNGVVLVAALYATAAVTVAKTRVTDPDVWWVSAAGREMRASGRVPSQNVFSYVEPLHAWLMHEWLLGPPYAAGLERFGPSVFVAIALGVLAIDMSLVLAATLGRSRTVPAGLFMAFCAIGGFGMRFLSARPTGVALVFPMAMALVAFAPRFTVLSVLLAALVELVWTNTHGSFPLGLVLLGLGAVDASRGANPGDPAHGGGGERVRRFAAVGAAAVVTAINPYGTALYGFVWNYFRGQDGIYKEIHAHIVEFGSLRSAWGGTVGPADLVAFAFFLVLALAAALHPRHRLRAMFCIAMLVLGAFQVRHLELAGLLTCFLLLPYADDLAERWKLPDKPGRAWRVGAAAAILPPALALGVALFVQQHGLRSEEAWIAEGTELVPSLADVPDGAHLNAPFQWGGFAIWYGFPRGIRVFFDPRNDCYTADAFRRFDAFDLLGTTPDQMRDILATSDTNAVLVPAKHRLAALLATEPGWKLRAEHGAYWTDEHGPIDDGQHSKWVLYTRN
jgi:hypothetical protein